MAKIEHRTYAVRASQGDEFALVGRALTYSEISSNELAPGLRERMMPGCFSESLASGREVKALLNHDSQALPLGSTKSGTLTLHDSSDFLAMRCQLDSTNSFHRDVYSSVRRGDLSEMSFAFICEEDDFQDGFAADGQRCQVRNVKKAQLLDVSVVGNAFYGDNATAIAARAAQGTRESLLDKVLAMPATWELQDRATALGLKIAAEK